MLELIEDTRGKLGALAQGLRTDPAAWGQWQALVFAIPRNVAHEKLNACMADIVELMKRQLVLADGMVLIPDPHSCVVIVRLNDNALLVESGMQATTLAMVQTNGLPSYEIYQLDRDASAFIDLIYHRFGLEQGSPQPWSSPSQLLRFCRDEEPARHHPIRSSLQKSLRVLLIEDDPVTRWLVRNALKGECELMTAASGNKALNVYQSYAPDLVFLDIGLPDRDGGSVLDGILRHDPGANVVMFTHNDNFDTMIDTMSRGARGFVAKPFYRSRLLHYIKTA